MSPVKPMACAAMIGDLVGSRRSTDRERVHRRLTDVLARSVSWVEPADLIDAPTITAGDEYQGRFATVGAALWVAWRVRLDLLADPQLPVDLRIGIGWGPVEVLDAGTGIQDGPGWWAARAAIEEIEAESRGAASRHARVGYRLATGLPGPDPAPIAAALRCQDQMVGSLSARSQRLLAGLVAGQSQAELATREKVTASAVSQRVRGDGLAVLVRSAAELAEVR